MGYKMRRNLTAYLMLLPTLLLIGVFVIYPIIESFLISFFQWDMMSPDKPFVGLANYVHIFQDPLFQKALVNTLLYVICFVPLVLIIGLLSAVLLNAKVRFLTWFRTAMFIPYITTLAASGIVWRWIFNDQYGLLNYLLSLVHIHPQDWLSNPHLTLFNMVVMGVWQNLGYVTVIFLAGLQAISTEYYEAADVDGANAWQKFRHLTIPLVSPTTYFLLILTTIEAFKVFLQVYVLYGESSGPNSSGETLLFYMFEKGFGDFRMGYAAATAYVLFLIIFAFNVVQMALSRRVHYE